MHSKNKA